MAIDDSPADTRCKANWARLIQKVYEVDPLECTNCADNDQENGMFDQMVGWTVDRAYLEVGRK